MARITVEDCMQAVGGNRFALVWLSSRRSRQLLSGAHSALGPRHKAPVTSLREISASQVRFDRPLRDALAGKFDRKPTGPTVLRAVPRPSRAT